ncbi:hypothetical protein ABEG17_01350 [Pedococcus sp. KACC 23699]|uniref:Uncharacterized protein n=1 Tax=Pedococcus sp. KACC 23699 TaxID=3149228 RepID=A0AAU7JVW0_9MICO
MDTASFQKLRLAVQENANPADDRYVTALQGALDQGLRGSRLFAEVELGRTDDVDRMVIGICRCVDDVAPWEAGVGIERMWGVVAMDTRWEIHHVSSNDSYMEFEAAVTMDDSGRYITVNLVAEPARVAHPVEADADQPASTLADRPGGSSAAGPDGLPPRTATIDA